MEEKPRLTTRTKSFIREVQTEVKKVTWPTRGELYGATSVVIACTILLSIVLGVFDFLIGHVMHFMLQFGL